MASENKFTHFGTLLSRDPKTGDKSVFGHLYNFNTKSSIEYKELPKNVKSSLSLLLKQKELKLKFVVEIFILFSTETEKYKVLLSKRAKIASRTYPNVLVDLLKEKIINEKELVQKFPFSALKEGMSKTLLNPKGNPIEELKTISYGAANGIVLFDEAEVKAALKEKKEIVWVLDEISADNIKLFEKVSGLVFTKAGPTSHAAVIAKGLGIPAITGTKILRKKEFLKEEICIDANSGRVYKGSQELTLSSEDPSFKKVLEIAEKLSKVKVQANADNKSQIKKAKEFRAQGIGLCRTEHMFTDPERANLIRQFLFSDSPGNELMQKLEKQQTKDFVSIFAETIGKEVIVRFLDAPLHEFMPNSDTEISQLAKDLKLSLDELKTIMKSYKEKNPMLGFRGVRMLLKKPEIIRVQSRAIFKAANIIKEKTGNMPILFLEVPLIVNSNEFDQFAEKVISVAKEMEFSGDYKLGAMIETPSAAIEIASIAEKVEFISFGTNDLTQMTLGFSRDDSNSFMTEYIEKRLITADPFTSLEISSVGKLINFTSAKAKRMNPDILIGVCGEQAADPESIRFLLKTKIDSISCSPARVPIALLAAAKYSV